MAQLNFKGKPFVQNEHLGVNYHELVPKKDKSLTSKISLHDEVYLFYKPDLNYLKNTALTLDRAKALGAYRGKKRLIFAPTKYLDQDYLDELRIIFAQLPFEIYKLAR